VNSVSFFIYLYMILGKCSKLVIVKSNILPISSDVSICELL